MTRVRVVALVVVLSMGLLLNAQTDNARPKVVQPNLTDWGSEPFHLKATITDIHDASDVSEVEYFWAAPNRFRRTIHSEIFDQTIIVDGNRTFEENSNDYFPLALQDLTTAVVNPEPLLANWEPGRIVLTKANGASSESGAVCFPGLKMCMGGRYGLQEQIQLPGNTIEFTDYRKFNDLRVARRVMSTHGGQGYVATVTVLEKLKERDEKNFEFSDPTAPERAIRSVRISQAELLGLALQPTQIIWPQTLDGAETGTSTYLVSLDRSGSVREVVPIISANERANDSAEKQIKRWKFKPLVKAGTPVQAQAVLKFQTDTRAYGPREMLTNEEARKLASDIVEPNLPDGSVPSGSIGKTNVAVDSDGETIEQIAGEGPRELVSACMKVVGHWKFHPPIENGIPVPFRAQITCVAP